MTVRSSLLLCFLLSPATILADGDGVRTPETADAEASPPVARRVDHVDTYHGVEVADPYRWLEDTGSPEAGAWVRAQDEHARRFVGGLPKEGAGERAAIRRRIARIADVTRYGVPQSTERGHFYFRADGSFSRRELELAPPGEKPRLMIAAADLGEETRLGRFVAHRGGRLVAYAVAATGSRWERWRVRDSATGRDLGDEVAGANRGGTSVFWAVGGSGFYYERYDLPAAGAERGQRLEGERLFFHRLGTPQAEDRLVYDPGKKDLAVASALTADGRYLVVQVSDQGSPKNRVLVRDLAAEDAGFVPLVAEADATYSFVGAEGPVFWFYTTAGAPRGRVIAVDLRRPERESWREVVPESADTIDTTLLATAAGGRLVVAYRKDAWLALEVFHPDGRRAYSVELPKVGSIWSFAGHPDDPEAFFNLSDFTDPGTVYRLHLESGEISAFRRPQLAYDPDAFVTRQVFFTGKDGTRVSMFVAHRRGLELDGSHPLFLYGYGAFAWAASPWFQPQVTAWLEMGGVYALPNIRGGGEYGEAWHQAGIRRRKQTSIDDYLAAAEWLIAHRYTSRELLVANGGSASGPLVGAAVVQRPGLFAASVIDFPALDMLRLEEFTGGRRWRSDFGTTTDPDDFRALHAYSPVHNVRLGVCYPATLIAPGELDEATVPMHAYKFAAALQHAQECERPILLRVSWGAGHSYGATNEDSMDTWADQIAFLVRVLGLGGEKASADGAT